ncbi:MAG: TIGR00730 family Rossman fold protein [Bacteroidales bacterium]|nr:TIGR00730 family Rossman fold protein [Bacteroidales bacterium]
MLGEDHHLNEEEKIRKAFSAKDWNEIKTNDSWQMFKIISEVVGGFEKLARIGPCVSVFGSARTKPQHKNYKIAEEIAYKLTQNGFGIITGGGPGIMEAANKGASRGNGKSVGLNIALPFEQASNKFIDPDKLFTFDHFFIRKVMFMKYSQGYIVMPGGFGTLDEFFEAVTLIQTQKMVHFPIILVVKDYWEDMIKWIKNRLLEEKNISPEDIDIIQVVDSADEAVNAINKFYEKYSLKPNF